MSTTMSRISVASGGASRLVDQTSGQVKARHLLIIDDGGDTLPTALEWTRRHAESSDRITVLTTVSHVCPTAGSEFSFAAGEHLPSEADVRNAGAALIRRVFGADEIGERVRHVVRRGYVHRVVDEYTCDSTVVVVAQSATRRWVDRVSPSPIRRLIGRTRGPLIIVQPHWDEQE